ncbi:MAG TPA: helix-turn-helix domain-containing protein [Pseudolabrys sp.]|nr:helix-turn-helix domain-containing protein [Pseudolabrys sp.]
MISWSTDAVNDRERFAYWREVVCKNVYDISPEMPSERFYARIAARNSDALRFVSCESTSYEIVRTARDIAKGPADHYTVYLQVRGETTISIREKTIRLNRNEIAVFDGEQPFRAAVSEDGWRAIAVLPRSLMTRRAPWLKQRALWKIAATAEFADFARGHMHRLVFEGLTGTETNLLSENFCNLLALATAPDRSTAEMKSELQLEAIFAFCRNNLCYPSLSAQSVAERFGISVRTLHLRFERLGYSFGQWLLQTRLDACAAVLKNPDQCCNISDIAYGSGFNDLSHFNRAFRARFGMTPSQMRSAANSRRAES